MKNVSEVVLGGLYKANPAQISGARKPSHEQSYGTFIACLETITGKVWMLDTYKLESNTFSSSNEFPFTLLGRSQNFIDGVGEKEAKVSEWTVRHTIYDGYYSSSAELTEYNAAEFEFLGYLPDYRAVSSRDADDYSEEDVIRGVKLWRDHAYPQGIDLVRKEAQADTSRIFNALVSDFRSAVNAPSIFFDFAKLEETARKIDGCELEVKTLRREYDMLREMEVRWRETKRAMKLIRESGDESALDAWDAGVPADDIFA